MLRMTVRLRDGPECSGVRSLQDMHARHLRVGDWVIRRLPDCQIRELRKYKCEYWNGWLAGYTVRSCSNNNLQ